jgi:hypothetical protein
VRTRTDEIRSRWWQIAAEKSNNSKLHKQVGGYHGEQEDSVGIRENWVR